MISVMGGLLVVCAWAAQPINRASAAKAVLAEARIVVFMMFSPDLKKRRHKRRFNCNAYGDPCYLS
jgi:hypothetical protein